MSHVVLHGADVRIVEEQPGDGTRYTIVVVGPLVGEVEGQAMGHVTDGWLIVNAMTRAAYLFQPQSDGPLAWYYVREKLGPMCEKTAQQITRMIGKTIDREVIA